VIERVREAVLSGPGELSPEVRRRAADGGPLPEAAQRYCDLIERHAYRVVDADTEALAQAGWSDEAIFELTLAASLGAGLRRLDAGLGAL
jgi:alkylhydroperoxidase family enzyme